MPPVDWQAPWLAPWRTSGESAARLLQAGLTQPQALNLMAQARWPAPGQAPVLFVPQQELPSGQAYEQYIFDHGRCPTREGLHDFFNGLVWLALPQTKRRLNQLQAAQIARSGIKPTRGAARDALTLFDENAALLRAPDALWDALVAKDWPQVFGDLRPLWAQSSLLLFGHALMEKLVQPRKSITAHVYRVAPAKDSLETLDAWLAADLSAEKLAAKPFAHLPVLGVPGWWPDNELAGFYADATVFRAPRAAVANPGKST